MLGWTVYMLMSVLCLSHTNIRVVLQMVLLPVFEINKPPLPISSGKMLSLRALRVWCLGHAIWASKTPPAEPLPWWSRLYNNIPYKSTPWAKAFKSSPLWVVAATWTLEPPPASPRVHISTILELEAELGLEPRHFDTGMWAFQTLSSLPCPLPNTLQCGARNESHCPRVTHVCVFKEK